MAHMTWLTSPQFRPAVRVVFFAASAGSVFMSLIPRALQLPGPLWQDKVQHVVAYVVLAFLGRLGWPSRLALVAVALAFVGGLIELLQGTTIIHRDMSAWDWYADLIGICVGALAAALITSGDNPGAGR